MVDSRPTGTPHTLVDDHRIIIQVVDTLNSTVVSIKPVVKSFDSFSSRMTRIVNSSHTNSEAIFGFIVDKRCIVNDAHVAILFEAVDRTSVHVMSSQLASEVDFGLPALAEEGRLSGVVLHVAKIQHLAANGENGGQPDNWHMVCYTIFKP